MRVIKSCRRCYDRRKAVLSVVLSFPAIYHKWNSVKVYSIKREPASQPTKRKLLYDYTTPPHHHTQTTQRLIKERLSKSVPYQGLLRRQHPERQGQAKDRPRTGQGQAKDSIFKDFSSHPLPRNTSILNTRSVVQ